MARKSRCAPGRGWASWATRAGWKKAFWTTFTFRSRTPTEISASSTESFKDAIEDGIDRTNKTLDKVKGAWINEMKVDVEDGKITNYRVNMKVTFVLKG